MEILKAKIEERKAAGMDVSELEVAYQYFTNPSFRAWLEEATFEINQARA